jgi:hypothetical protein
VVGYFINGYWWLVTLLLVIGGYWWLAILLMAIGDYSVISHW